MPRLFIPPIPPDAAQAAVEGEAAAHLARSLRVRPGERIVLVTGDGVELGLVVERVSPSRVEGQIAWRRPATGEPALEVHVVQALAKDGMEEAVDALAQVGAAAVWPVLTARTVSRPDPATALRRQGRWQKIAQEAAQLAGRGRIPTVHALHPLGETLAQLPGATRILACMISPATTALSRLRVAGPRLAICIGPEGGFGPADVTCLEAAMAEPVHLGGRVIRTRLAGAMATAMALRSAGDLDSPLAPAPWSGVTGDG